jgi:hypothetical protein
LIGHRPNSAWALPSFIPTVHSQLYSTRYSDAVWYRVQLILIKDNAVGEVHFVYYGDSHEVTLVVANVHPLPRKRQAVSPFATRCQLQLPNKRDIWSPAIFEFFKRNCRPEMVLKAVLGVKEDDVQLVESLI